MVPGDQWRLIVLLLIAPVTEEIVFRWGLHEALLRRLRTRHLANMGVGLVFAGAHALTQHAWSGLAVLVPALIVGAVYDWSRKLLPCVLLHAVMNACWVIWSLNTNGQLT